MNGETVQVPKGSTVMQACDAAGIDIPRCAARCLALHQCWLLEPQCPALTACAKTQQVLHCCVSKDSLALLHTPIFGISSGLPLCRFCYHQKLSIAGNCRMCLVEVS